ncbi:rhodanese-like domain-containing protein [Phenylobacterium sp.]|jgi:rhodanese-related sulfurtransferase|uniref:rhodanese-like domain-containing protein n=1 Tax=Phenylobacterium sp. TaxID=1871053 RepID=UPI0037CC8CB5
MTQPKTLSPREAADLIERGALIVDIREDAEREVGVIPGAAHAPLSQLAERQIASTPGQPLIFHCKAGGRTAANAAALAAKAGDCEPYLLQGGIEAWAAEGLPIERPS